MTHPGSLWAVAAAVLDPEDHLLISATRLDEVPLQQVAGRLGVSVTVAAGWRRRAEARLARVIREGELSGITLDATLRRARAARNAASRSLGMAQPGREGSARHAG